MTKTDLEGLLDVIANKATALRNAGVTALSVGDVSIELAARELPDAIGATKNQDEDEPKRAIDDKDTFGGREAPRRRRVEEPNDR